MIKFFRRIRQQLLSQNKFSKYIFYAIGEIVLIMIGIFMALQLNNWNLQRKQEAQFKVTLEQLYNSIYADISLLEQRKKDLTNQIDIIDMVLIHPDSIPLFQIPTYLYELTFDYSDYHLNETTYHLKNLIYNPDDVVQKEITEQIVNYVSFVNSNKETEIPFDGRLKLNLQKYHIPMPKMLDINLGFDYVDSTYYSHEELKAGYNLMHSHNTSSILKTIKTEFIWEDIRLKNSIISANNILKMIRNYYSEVKLLFKEVGIIGTSLDGWDDVGARSTPMIQTDVKNSVWEIDLFLKEGQVKFRCRDAWSQSWGGDSFPKSEAIWNGKNIIVNEGGYYHITLNINELTYNFEKLKDSLQIIQ